MNWLIRHLRNKLGAGLLAAIPLVIVVVAAIYIEMYTRPLAKLAGFDVPGVGVVLAVVAVYLLGILVTSLLGKMFLSAADRLLNRIPGLHQLYSAWKEILVLSPSKASVFHQVVLAIGVDGKRAQIGFTSGVSLPGSPQTICVFLPNAPNPVTGWLTMLDRSCCLPLRIPVTEAFKFLLSSGNYVPPEMQALMPREVPGAVQ
jgi:uncharacterized membrane protein